MKKRSWPSNQHSKSNAPEARFAMDKFKPEAAAEVGIDLKESC